MTAMRILHVLRAPVGGLFRHVRDLARAQAEAGHAVGLICDATTGGAAAEAALADIAHHCRLGVLRVAMARVPGPGDLWAARRIIGAARGLAPDIVHGHGAKGGVYARLAAARLGAASVYTPHGGVLHYDWSDPRGVLYLGVERLLARRTGGFVFVCDYERRQFEAKIGLAEANWVVARNGLWPEEFAAIPLAPEASDVVFIGELRALKGVDVLIEALARLAPARTVTATIVGDGADAAALRAQAAAAGLGAAIRFAGALPAARALALGWLMVVPSRAESFPYVVVEAAAAARPIVASRVGGIPEVLPDDRLVPAGDAQALAAAIGARLADRAAAETAAAELAASLSRELTVTAMAATIGDFYARLARAG